MITASRRTSVGELLSGFQAVLSRYGALLLLIGVVLGVVDTLLTYFLGERRQGAPSGIVGLIVGYFLLKELLSREGLVQTQGGFWSYFGAGILTGVGVVVGLICLIVPGFYIAARWCLAPAIVLARGDGATDSIRASAAATKGNVWAIVLFGIIVFGIYFVIAAVIGFALGFGGLAGSLVQIAVTEFLGAIGSMFGAAAIVAVYRLLVGGVEEFEETFA